MREIDQVKPTLDPVYPRFHPVDPALNADGTFVNGGQSHFDIVHVSGKPTVDPPNVLQDEVARFISHGLYSAAMP